MAFIFPYVTQNSKDAAHLCYSGSENDERSVLPTNARHKTEANLRDMARNMVDMMTGIYEWPDGKRHFDKTGAPLINKAELMRSVGYSVNYTKRGKPLFEDPYFKQQVALESARRKQYFAKLDLKTTVDVEKLGLAMMSELQLRMDHDPTTIRTGDLMKYGPAIYKVGLEIAAKKDAAKHPGKAKGLINRGIIAQNVLVMGDEEREKVIEASNQRQEEIRMMVEAANARDVVVDSVPID